MYTIFFTINCVEQLIFSCQKCRANDCRAIEFFFLKVKLLESSSSPKINWIQAIDKKKYYCSNGVEQIFWAIKFRADDYDPLVRIPTISSTTQPKYSHMSQKNYSWKNLKISNKQRCNCDFFLNLKLNLLVVFGKYVLQKTKTK